MTGAEIKSVIMKKGVRVWQVAKAYGVADTTFSKYLRGEFNDTETQKILEIINELAEE